MATAFAAKDLLGNMLSGVSLQFLRPFSVGDFIRVRASSPTPLIWISTIVCQIQH